MRDIFRFLFNPESRKKKIFKKDNEFKWKTIIILTILYWFSTPIFYYISHIGEFVDNFYYLKLFFYTIITEIIFVFVLYWTWKILEWKAKFIDVYYITIIPQLSYILVSVLLLALLYSAPALMFFLAPFLIVMAFAWFLITWIYWLSSIEKLSNIKLFWMILVAELVCVFADYLSCFILSVKFI